MDLEQDVSQPETQRKLATNSQMINTILFLIVSNMTIISTQVYASDMNCDKKTNHENCTGERGRGGIIFCDLQFEGDTRDCYDRNYDRKDCDENPDQSSFRCLRRR